MTEESTNTNPIKGTNEQMKTDIPTKIFRGGGFITTAIYNNTGSIIYIGDKDSKTITAIYTKTNEILGIFHGHTGTIWHLAVSNDDNILISCGADMLLCFFNTKNGEIIHKIKTPGIPKQISIIENQVIVYYDSFSKRLKSYFAIYDLTTLVPMDIKLIKQIESDNTNKPLVLKWFDATKIIIGHESGLITIKDIFDESVPVSTYNFHTGGIKSLVFNNARNKILTGSSDSKSILIEIKPNNILEVINTFQSTCPVNNAIFNHNEKQIILGGGDDAIGVAMSGTNDFKLKYFDIKKNKLISQISSHFGPIRYLDRAPNSKNFVSASQDGTVKIYQLDEEPNEIEKNEKPDTFGLSDYELIILSDDITKRDYINAHKKKESSDNNLIIKPLIEPISSTLFNVSKELESIKLVKVNKTVKIGGLSKDVDRDKLIDLFECYGAIEDRGIIFRFISGDFFVFIKYKSEESAKKAFEKHHNKNYGLMIITLELV